jgi:hypothetical protein
MIDRALYRPREIIQFCFQALEHARDTQTPVPLGLAVLREVEHSYSRERTRDIAAEYRFHYPGLLSVMEAFRGRGAILTHDEASAGTFLGPHQGSAHTVTTAGRFQIHPMFWANLGTQETRQQRAPRPGKAS